MASAPVSEGPSLVGWAWGIAGATALLTLFIALGALFSRAPGDRPGGLWFGGLLGVGVIAAIVTRFRPASMNRVVGGLALGQLAVGLLLAVQGVGALRVITILTVLLTTGWAVAAVLFVRARRQPPNSAAV
jgi:hypothetical protein